MYFVKNTPSEKRVLLNKKLKITVNQFIRHKFYYTLIDFKEREYEAVLYSLENLSEGDRFSCKLESITFLKSKDSFIYKKIGDNYYFIDVDHPYYKNEGWPVPDLAFDKNFVDVTIEMRQQKIDNILK